MRYTTVCLLAIVILLGLGEPVAAGDEDVLARILDEVGFDRSDLGYQPKGYWNRFPLDIPYRLSSFDDLLAEPLKLYDYATVMGHAVEIYLDPAFADTSALGLYKLVYHLGVDKKLGGFRDYSANLAEAPRGEEPLLQAVENIFRLADRETEYRTFGGRYDSPGLRNEIVEQAALLPDTVEGIIAGLLVNLTEAIRLRNLAFRNCDRNDMEEVFAIRDLAKTQSDGQVYYHAMDDIAAEIDWPSLHYAALKTVAAAEYAERALQPYAQTIPDDFQMEIATPFGRIILLSPTYNRDEVPHPFFSSLRAPRPGWMACDVNNTLCVIDFGRHSIWHGAAGATASIANPVSVLIDLGGDDYYGYEEANYPPTTGAGLMGIGVVLDSRGDDHYNGSIYAQGVGVFGVGVLLDRAGRDHYRAAESAQGCGYFGIGLCFDGTGDDEYYLYGDGQGMGGVGGGVGVLASFDGDDHYTAEPRAEVYDRGDYHSEHTINGNNAQGAGFGRRGDGSDGHAWAGGLGAIIDVHGNDEYYSGNFTLGIGYWFGTGIAWDGTGDDHYKSCYFTQGSGAHFCNGILIDEQGNDYHELYETAGAGLGFGWDFTNAFLINKGGNDRYRAKMISLGVAQIRSNAFLIDIGGNDEYSLAEGARGFGEATWREDFAKPSRLTPYYTYAKSFGGFIDIGGNDLYYSFDADNHTTAHPLAGNDRLWFQPARTDSTFGANNYGVGIDIETGRVPELFKWE